MDTYEALRDAAFGKAVFIGGEYTFGIDHCLLVQKGTRLEEVKRIMSHEQVCTSTRTHQSEGKPID